MLCIHLPNVFVISRVWCIANQVAVVDTDQFDESHSCFSHLSHFTRYEKNSLTRCRCRAVARSQRNLCCGVPLAHPPEAARPPPCRGNQTLSPVRSESRRDLAAEEAMLPTQNNADIPNPHGRRVIAACHRQHSGVQTRGSQCNSHPAAGKPHRSSPGVSPPFHLPTIDERFTSE